MARNQDFVQNVIGLVEIENQIQLTDVPEIFVKNLHEKVNQLQNNQLIVLFVDDCYEIKTRVSIPCLNFAKKSLLPFVNNFVIIPLDEIAKTRRPSQHHVVDLPREKCVLEK